MPTDPHGEFARAVARAATAHDREDGGADAGGAGQALVPVDDAGLLRLAGRSARQAGSKAVASGKWLSEIALDVAGHIPIRDIGTLREHHHGLDGALLAGALIRAAGRSTATVGAATGALAAASQVNPATWATLPVELAAETLIVVAVEMKLVGELHEAAGHPLPRGLRDKGPLVARSWAESRGINPADLARLARTERSGAMTGAAADLLSRSARDQLTIQLKRRILRRSGRNLATFTPLLVGAAAGAALNRRATRMLGTKVATSLGIPPPGS